MSIGQDQETLESAVVGGMAGRRPEGLKESPAVHVQRSVEGWAFGSVSIHAPSLEAKTEEEERLHHGGPEASLWLARTDKEGSWNVFFEWTKEFYEALDESPNTLLASTEKTPFESDWVSLAANDTTNAAVVSADDLQQFAPMITGDPYTDVMLPWPQGESWRLRGGPHGWNGNPRPWSSIDLNGIQNIPYQVKASNNGRFFRPCGNDAYVCIKHGNGWESHYYHMDRVPGYAEGQNVYRTNLLGWTSTRINCGGAASGPHVHFAMKYNGNWIDLNGRTIGGWTIREGAGAYQGWVERADARGNLTRAFAGSTTPVYNVGVQFAVHMQNAGWMPPVSNFALAGLAGQGLRMEAINISIQRPPGTPGDVGICYDAHVQDIGWQGPRCNGQTAGTTGQNRRIEAIRIWLVNPPAGAHVAYKAFVEGVGWGPLTYNGAVAGTTGQSRRIEAIQVGLLP